MQNDFLHQYIEQVLTQIGITNLSDEQKQSYFPQLAAQLEQRMGLELMPKLNQEQLGQFARLLDNMHTSPEDWNSFWHEAIPDYEDQLHRILQEFANDVKQSLS